MEKPQHQHDCNSCRFIGYTKKIRSDGARGDVYLCDLVNPAMIIRYSDTQEDYSFSNVVSNPFNC